MLNLIFSKKPKTVRDVQDLGFLSSSDHKLICCSLAIDVTVDRGNKSTMKYDNNKMNRTGIEAELRSTDWDEVCAGSVEESWGRFKNILLDLQHRFVLKVKYGKSGKVQWLNYRALKYVRMKHKVYRRYMDRSHVA